MNIKLRTYYWNKDKTKIIGQGKVTLSEEELCEIINNRYVLGEESVPINLNKEDIIFETSVDETII